MKPFVLRRLKSDVLQDLPKKTDHIIHVPMAPTQQIQYEDLVNSFKNIDKVKYLLKNFIQLIHLHWVAQRTIKF